MSMQAQSRDEIEERYRWNLADIYPSDESFLEALDDAAKYPASLASFRETATSSAADLLAFLLLDDETTVVLGKLVNYAMRKADEDTRNSTYQDYSNRVMLLYTKVSAAVSWFSSALLELNPETMESYYASEPALETYRTALDRIFRRRAHTLSPSEEAILANSQEIASQPGNIFSLLNDADLRFEDALDEGGSARPVTHGSYISLMMSPDRTLRRNAYNSMYAVYGQFKNTLSATLGAQTKQIKFYADTRKYPSALAYALDGNEIPEEVYTNLIAAVQRNLEPLHSYIDLRKRLLGVDELHYYDLYVPIVEDVEMTFTYDEACELILKALEPMGEAYLDIVHEGLGQRWIDVYETPGKRSGGYSAGSVGTHPYVLLNFQGTLDDVFTLVHEMGHSVHTYLSCASQPVCYSDYAIFVAEVASTCNEALLMDYLLRTCTDPRQRAYLINHFLEEFRGTLYRQCMFAQFELTINEVTARGETLTPDALCELYAQLNLEYYGEGIALDEQISLEWARIPHFYYQFYVYQYATGFAAAIALSRQILDEGAPAVERYTEFLKGGSSKTPIELLRGAGVDMSSPAPIDEALAFFATLVEELSAALER